jgi:hypothetical protein
MNGLTSAITAMVRKELKVSIYKIALVIIEKQIDFIELMVSVKEKKITVTACDMPSRSKIGPNAGNNIEQSFDLLHFTPQHIRRIVNLTVDQLPHLKLYVDCAKIILQALRIPRILCSLLSTLLIVLLTDTSKQEQQINCTWRQYRVIINSSSCARTMRETSGAESAGLTSSYAFNTT